MNDKSMGIWSLFPRKVKVALIVILLFPFQTTIVPDWPLTVIDVWGQPLCGIEVEQVWQHYALETEGNYDYQTTNDLGQVFFPARTKWATLAFYLFGIVRNTAECPIDASYGPSANIYAKQESEEGLIRGSAHYWPGKTPPKYITLNCSSPCKRS